MMLIARRKQNDELTNNSEIVHRRIINDELEIEENVADLAAIARRHPYNFRLYVTANARDMESAMFQFSRYFNEIIEGMYRGNGDRYTQLARLGSGWKSVVHSPESRAEKKFLFDFDQDLTMGQRTAFVESLPSHADLHRWYETPNGFHAVTDPFNYKQWSSPIEYDERDSDGQLFIAEQQAEQ